MANATAIPNAPAYLPEKAQKQWTAAYAKALAQARIDYPDNASAQTSTARKAANALLAVSAPASPDEIDKLEDWQVILRETRAVKGAQTRVCVTTDGRKYAFPIPAPAAKQQAPKGAAV